jgi:prolipoprotein diacylglyceryltransferase
MYPILFRLGPLTFQTYTVLIDLGILLGLVWLYLNAPQEKAGRWLDVGLAGVVGALVGARLLYTFANSSYYFGHPEEIVMIWQGGLSWPGAALGGVLGAGLYGTRKREPFAPIFDALAWPVVFLSLLSWGGCLAAGSAYGAEVTAGQPLAGLAMNAPDLYGVVALRWPTQVLGILWSVVALGLMWLAARFHWRQGARGFFAVALVALGAFAISFMRGDPDPGLGGLRLDTVGSALVLLVAVIGWVWLVRKPTPSAPAPISTAEPEPPKATAGEAEPADETNSTASAAE